MGSKQITKRNVFEKLSHSKHEKNMLRYELAAILCLTVMSATFFKHKPHFEYIENLPANVKPFSCNCLSKIWWNA